MLRLGERERSLGTVLSRFSSPCAGDAREPREILSQRLVGGDQMSRRCRGSYLARLNTRTSENAGAAGTNANTRFARARRHSTYGVPHNLESPAARESRCTFRSNRIASRGTDSGSNRCGTSRRRSSDRAATNHGARPVGKRRCWRCTARHAIGLRIVPIAQAAPSPSPGTRSRK
jgi:hypothetical protein